METLLAAAIVCSLTAIRSVLYCAEILVQAWADNMREHGRRTTILTIMEAMQPSGVLTASDGSVEIRARKPTSHGE